MKYCVYRMKGMMCMMVEVLNTPDPVYGEWKKLITTKKFNSSIIHPQISESWLRCFQQGVNPYSNGKHRALDKAMLHKKREENKVLIQIAKPFMENLHKFVKGSGFVVVLTDEEGSILEMFGDEGAWRNPLTNNFFPGAGWEETEAGTNAIGTALIIGEPIQVSGAEHFCQKHHCLTCSAAPIFDAKKRVIGVLDMSGSVHSSHMHTLGMIVAAAEAIMAQLSIKQKNNELAVINNRLTNFFNAVSDGVIIFDSNGVVNESNPAARSILGRSLQQLNGLPLSRIFEERSLFGRSMLTLQLPFNDVEVMVDTRDGLCCCLASGEPIWNEDGIVNGGIIILRPIKQVQNLVNRFSGYSATLQFCDIIGDSAEIGEGIRIATLAANNTSNVLLQGESGTGKEIFAQAIHNQSSQNTGPFIAVNCGAIPRELIASELFGYEEGAFTGAKRGGKPGKFELASGGTIFLDEISDMPLEQQTALLRVIQEKKVTRIGGNKMIPITARLLCATNKNLRHEVERGAFRQDLFYRLNVLSITIPPLRCRISDIPLLFAHFLDKLSHDWDRTLRVEPEVMELLLRYSWPGNVRELQNIVERAASLSDNGVIGVKHLPIELHGSAYRQPYIQDDQYHRIFDSRQERQKIAKEMEKTQILNLINRYAGNVSQVAREMGVSRKTLYNKMRVYAIQN